MLLPFFKCCILVKYVCLPPPPIYVLLFLVSRLFFVFVEAEF